MMFSVHAFGYNFTESERIWMTSGVLMSTVAGPGKFWARSAQ